jgi:reverse gyrase
MKRNRMRYIILYGIPRLKYYLQQEKPTVQNTKSRNPFTTRDKREWGKSKYYVGLL